MPDIRTPGPKKGVLNELPWEDQQRIMGYSLAQINKLKRDDLIRAANIPKDSLYQSGKKSYFDEPSQVDEALKKIARAGDDFSSMRDYARALIKRFDSDNDGVITFQELCDGLRTFDIDLPLKDRIALMHKLDVDKDGEITEVELSRALSSVDSQMTGEAVDTCIRKIAGGAENFSSMRDYVKELMRRFDENHDGLITVGELADGLRKMGIFLTGRER
jgi:Ca2+-binding EF-hand superfamily protein